MADTTTLATLMTPQVEPTATIVTYNHKKFMALLVQAAQAAGIPETSFVINGRKGHDFQWRVERGARIAAEIFTEATATPAIGSATYAAGTLGYTNFRNVIGLTGIAAEDLDGASYLTGPAYDEAGTYGDLDAASRAVNHLANLTLLGSATVGLPAAIDNGVAVAAYAGQNRLALVDLQSSQINVAGAQALANFSDLVEMMGDNDKGQEPDCWMGPLNQYTNHLRLVGPEAATSYVRFVSGQSPTVDSMYGYGMLAPGGKPFYAVPDMTDTVIYALRLEHWKLIVKRPLQAKPLPADGDMRSRTQVSSRLALAATDFGAFQGKLNTLTA